MTPLKVTHPPIVTPLSKSNSRYSKIMAPQRRLYLSCFENDLIIRATCSNMNTANNSRSLDMSDQIGLCRWKQCYFTLL